MRGEVSLDVWEVLKVEKWNVKHNLVMVILNIKTMSMDCVTNNAPMECDMFQVCRTCVSKEVEVFPMDAV